MCGPHLQLATGIGQHDQDGARGKQRRAALDRHLRNLLERRRVGECPTDLCQRAKLPDIRLDTLAIAPDAHNTTLMPRVLISTSRTTVSCPLPRVLSTRMARRVCFSPSRLSSRTLSER